MKIDYLVPQMYTQFDLEAKRNAGGGMMPNVNSRKTALQQRYDVKCIGSVEEITADFCLIESLFFSFWHQDLDKSELTRNALYAQKIEDLYDTPCKKLIACCELELARIPWWSRAKIKHYALGITVNTSYLWDIIHALGITPIGYLCDAIDPHLFKPGEKDMSVVACGGLKHIKNPYMLFEVFQKLKGKMKRVYIGNTAVWSNEKREEDVALMKELRSCVDVWIENASYVETAYHLAHAAIGINDTWHDVSSRTNQEMLMAGVVSVGGQHPLFNDRIGVHGLKTADEFVKAIESLTDGYTKLPTEASQKSREFALKNFSSEVFLEQFSEIIRSSYL